MAAEALRGVGGVLIDRDGKRFANELGRRDYVTGRMWKNKPPFRLCLNVPYPGARPPPACFLNEFPCTVTELRCLLFALVYILYELFLFFPLPNKQT